MTQLIRIAFTRIPDAEGGLEAKAVDLRTGFPIATLPPKELADWLEKNGFRCRPAAQCWELVA